MGACNIAGLITKVNKTGSIFMLPLRKTDDGKLRTCEMRNGMTLNS